MEHEHVWEFGWIRDEITYRACSCGIVTNPWTPEHDMHDYADPFAFLTGND